MKIKDNPKFLECVELSKKADELLGNEKHHAAEEKAISEFRKLVFGTRKDLKEMQSKIQAELSKKQSESHVAGINFCCIAGHNYQTVEFEQILCKSRLMYCKACGKFEVIGMVSFGDIRRFAKYDDSKMRQKVSQALKDESLKENKNYVRLKKEAEEFVKINKQIDKLNKWLSDIQEDFEELCTLFGHDCTRIDEYDKAVEPMCAANDDYMEMRREWYLNGRFKCRCCQKEIGTEEYKESYQNAKFRGGIIHHYYGDSFRIF